MAAFCFGCRHKKTPSIFSNNDVYPDLGSHLEFQKPFCDPGGFLAGKVLLAKIYLCQGDFKSFIPGLLRLGVPEEKLVLIYDWVDVDLIKPIAKENRFSQEHALDKKFVVQYAGNVGLSQALDCVLSAAEKLSDHPDIHFVVIGDGAAREDLIAQSKAMQLKNVSFIPFQPRERLPEVLSSADISLVTLKIGVGITALPSKTYSIFASGRPILASVDEGCETWGLIQQSGAGICVLPENVAELTKAILYLKENPALCNEMGRKGRIWAESKHSARSAAKEIETLFSQAIQKKV